MKTVQFVRISGSYQPGDCAKFSDTEADRLLRLRCVKVVEAAASDAPESEAAAASGEAKVLRNYQKK